MNRAWARRHWRIATGLLAVAVVCAILALHGYLDRDRGTPAPPASNPTQSAETAVSSPPPTARASGSGKSADALAFARHASTTLFDWDTTTDTRTSVTTGLLEIADPTGEQTPGLLADLPAWLPDDTWWQRLREYETRQRFEAITVEIPDAWNRAVQERRTGDLAPGAVAVTVAGVRHRHGVVAGEHASSTHEVTMTMFIVCPPDGDCWLARLGAPGKVLE